MCVCVCVCVCIHMTLINTAHYLENTAHNAQHNVCNDHKHIMFHTDITFKEEGITNKGAPQAHPLMIQTPVILLQQPLNDSLTRLSL